LNQRKEEAKTGNCKVCEVGLFVASSSLPSSKGFPSGDMHQEFSEKKTLPVIHHDKGDHQRQKDSLAHKQFKDNKVMQQQNGCDICQAFFPRKTVTSWFTTNSTASLETKSTFG